jgi:hypothetical protein
LSVQFSLLSSALAAQQSPFIVKIVEPKEPGVADVLLGALGITGVLILGATIVGLLFGGALFWIRSRKR